MKHAAIRQRALRLIARQTRESGRFSFLTGADPDPVPDSISEDDFVFRFGARRHEPSRPDKKRDV